MTTVFVEDAKRQLDDNVTRLVWKYEWLCHSSAADPWTSLQPLLETVLACHRDVFMLSQPTLMWEDDARSSLVWLDASSSAIQSAAETANSAAEQCLYQEVEESPYVPPPSTPQLLSECDYMETREPYVPSIPVSIPRRLTSYSYEPFLPGHIHKPSI